jgi:Ca2+-binding RTX toxin-like protein
MLLFVQSVSRPTTASILKRISTSATGAEATGPSINAQFSPDGRFVVFESAASNLVAGDTNNAIDIFLKDLATGAISRVSTTAAGAQAEAASSYNAQISADGRFVVFESEASNLVAGDTNNQRDIFLKDLATGAISRVSTTAAGAQADSANYKAQFSVDGRHLIFESFARNFVTDDTNNTSDIFWVDLLYKANAEAIAQGRFIETTLNVAGASSASIAWGDGTSSTVTPAGGSATFSHAYASTGTKAATVSLVEGALTWSVAHTINLSTGTMVRNTALADTLSGGSDADSLVGDGFANVLVGNSGHDSLTAYAGSDSLDAGSGNDSLYGGTEHDSLAGSLGNDRLYGESGNDSLAGGSGNDLLSASTGNDRLIGGTGKDTLTGSTGRDVFVFDDRETGSSKSRADYITDFSGRRGDRIDLKLVDANTKKRSDQKFSFIGDEESFSKAGEVRFEKTKSATYVYLNTDSDRSAEAVIKLKGSFDLSKSWFVL